jgi:ketosteroid isomerase-like protein
VIDDQAWLTIWNGPDLEAIRELSADDLEVTAVTAAIEPRHYVGKDAAVSWLIELQQRLGGDWSALRVTQLDEETSVTEGELRFEEPTTTGAESQPFAILMRFRNSHVRWIGTFIDLDSAREAWERGVGAEQG